MLVRMKKSGKYSEILKDVLKKQIQGLVSLCMEGDTH